MFRFGSASDSIFVRFVEFVTITYLHRLVICLVPEGNMALRTGEFLFLLSKGEEIPILGILHFCA
jgi:hypothetical protein